MSTKKNTKDPFDEKTVLSNLSVNLKSLFESRKIEPRPFALEHGIEPMTIYRILRAETTPKIHVVARLAYLLGVSIESLTNSPK